jgi:hypothetical protein
MFRKNTSGQYIHVQGVDSATGGIKSGVSWTVRRCIDGTFAAATGTATEDGSTGWYKFALSQADTNGNNIALNFTGTGAVPVTVNIVTTACDPTSAAFGLSLAKTTNITGFNDISEANVRTATGLASANLDTQLGVIAADTTTDIPATLATIAAYIDTEVAAIKAKTDNLPSDPADASDIATSFSAVSTALTTIAGYLDTEIAAIKSKTDNLPAAPAAVGDIPTAVQNADVLLNRDFSAVSDTNARTLLNAARFLRNKFSISESTLTVTKENDTTAAWTSTLTTSASAEPVTGSDPA